MKAFRFPNQTVPSHQQIVMVSAARFFHDTVTFLEKGMKVAPEVIVGFV